MRVFNRCLKVTFVLFLWPFIVCNIGTFGQNCSQACNCIEGKCENVNGTCYSICASGLKGSTCSDGKHRFFVVLYKMEFDGTDGHSPKRTLVSKRYVKQHKIITPSCMLHFVSLWLTFLTFFLLFFKSAYLWLTRRAYIVINNDGGVIVLE